MDRLRLVVAVAATFVVASIGVAAAADGDPVILGDFNESTSSTVISSDHDTAPALGIGTVGRGSYALEVFNESFSDDGAAALFWDEDDAIVVDGSIETERAGVVVIPAGQNKVTVGFPASKDNEDRVKADTLMVATTQGTGPPVRNVVPNPVEDEFTIRLTRAGTGPVTVGFFTIRGLGGGGAF